MRKFGSYYLIIKTFFFSIIESGTSIIRQNKTSELIYNMTDYSKDPAVNNLRDYLRIRSVQPNINYDECVSYLRRQATELGLGVQVYELVPKKPVLVMTWEGLEPALPSILLNSHMDVVPVFEKSWTYPPFDAQLVDGVIYARGAQDMKSVAIIYIEAVRRLKNRNIRLKRTVHLSFVPDEELGGVLGMKIFVTSEHYKKLNVGFALDEGLASPDDSYVVYNGERSIWHLKVICPGKSGHGSLLLPDNCGEKLRYIIDKFMDLRQESKKKLEDDPALTIGDVTSVNLTKISGGIQNNVIPEKFTASFDLRLALSVDFEEFENMIKQWCADAGTGVTYEFEQKDLYVPPTNVDNTNPYWVAFKGALDEANIPIKVRTFPGGTDSRFIRLQGTRALGVSPLRHTRPAIHEHDESIPASVFLEAVGVYEKLLPAVANVAISIEHRNKILETTYNMTDYSKDPAVNNLRDYLRIRSVHPNINYDECVSYLRRQATELGLAVQVFELVPKKPVLVMTWEGLEPALPSILLNSHMDVVPVFEKSWTYPPFDAQLVDGVIYARGAQDMKSVAIIYIEAVRRLKNRNIRLKRTVHLSFVPDEEVSSLQGMSVFVTSEHYQKLNVGFVLDEGLASPDDSYVVYNGERSIWHLKVICRGKSGHGSLLLPDNCGEKLRYIIDKFMDLRQESKKKLEDDPALTIGDVTSVNLTMISGGIQNNVIPESFTAKFDLRLALSLNHEEFENMIKQWCANAGTGVTYEFDYKDSYVAPTKVDNTNLYWVAFKDALDELNIPVKVRTFPGGTDSQVIRLQGTRALGISPLRHTRPAIHEDDESIPASVFLEAIGVYEKVIPAIANA